MKAVVIATGAVAGSLAPLDERTPAPLLPILDKPVVQHVVEYLIAAGITKFDFILSLMPEKLRKCLGDGRRWGATFSYYLARDPDRPYDLLAGLAESEDILLVATNTLVAIAPQLRSPLQNATAFYNFRTGEWTGWAWLPAGSFHLIPRTLSISNHRQHTFQQLQRLDLDALKLETFDELMDANRAALTESFEVLRPGVRSRQNGVWLSNNVVIHPTGKVIPPVFIGRNSRIMRGTQIGPNAVVGRDCIIDNHSIVTESVVFAATYVGEALELDQAIADKNRLVSLKTNSAIRVSDDFLLSGLRPEKRKIPGQLVSRCIAGLLLIGLLPLLVVVMIGVKLSRRGPGLTRRRVIRVPAETDPATWREVALFTFSQANNPFQQESGLRHMLFCFLPGLLSVAKGDLRFVGVPPRTASEVQCLPHDWRVLYLNSKAGIISEAYVQYGSNATEDDMYTAEVFYSASANRLHDFKLVLRYLASLGSSAERREDPGFGPLEPEDADAADASERGPLAESHD